MTYDIRYKNTTCKVSQAIMFYGELHDQTLISYSTVTTKFST